MSESHDSICDVVLNKKKVDVSPPVGGDHTIDIHDRVLACIEIDDSVVLSKLISESGTIPDCLDALLESNSIKCAKVLALQGIEIDYCSVEDRASPVVKVLYTHAGSDITNTLLTIAVSQNNVRMVMVMHECGAGIRFDNDALLSRAVSQNAECIVYYLLYHGCNYRNIGVDVVLNAMRRGYVDSIRHVINYLDVADSDEYATMALDAGKVAVIECVLSRLPVTTATLSKYTIERGCIERDVADIIKSRSKPACA